MTANRNRHIILDTNGWERLNRALGDKVQLAGDDLFVINTQRLAQGIERRIGNSILIKVNQIGTLSRSDCVKEDHSS